MERPAEKIPFCILEIFVGHTEIPTPLPKLLEHAAVPLLFEVLTTRIHYRVLIFMDSY